MYFQGWQETTFQACLLIFDLWQQHVYSLDVQGTEHPEIDVEKSVLSK